MRMPRIGVTRLFEPGDRLIGTRLQQMHASELEIPKADLRIAAAEPDDALHERDYLLYRTSEQLAKAEAG